MIRYNGLKLLCGAMTLLGLAACSDAMDEQIGDKSSGTAYKVYKLNVRQVAIPMVPQGLSRSMIRIIYTPHGH